MGILFTPPEHRRRGHARRCVAALSRRLLSLGLVPFVYVEEDNAASRALFSGLGFAKEQQRSSWIGYLPTGCKGDGKSGCCY